MTPTEKRAFRARLRKAVIASGADVEVFNAFLFSAVEFTGGAKSCESKPMCPRHQRMHDHALIFFSLLKAMIGDVLSDEMDLSLSAEDFYL
jgi:hypothetical protein